MGAGGLLKAGCVDQEYGNDPLYYSDSEFYDIDGEDAMPGIDDDEEKVWYGVEVKKFELKH